jgi:WD40 repeat protein
LLTRCNQGFGAVLFTLAAFSLFISSGLARQSKADITMLPPQIDAENVSALQSVQQIDFADLPPEIRVETGWFAMSPDGSTIAAVRRDGGMVLWDTEGVLVDTFTLPQENGIPATILDASFGLDNRTLAVISTVDGLRYTAAAHVVEGETFLVDVPPQYGRPVRVWLDDETPHLWIETAPADADDVYQVVRLPYNAADDALMVLPSGPEQDDESFVRIGRIPAPLAITSTPDGLVRLWDLETGEITHEVQLDAVPVFGRVNETTGQQLAWRDPASEALYLLDFITGENTYIAPLGGDYVQAFMLSPSADVILGVHIGDAPVVVAWLSESGSLIELGNYREDCTRVPDLVQLSQDGRTLVVGCDAGLDIWQIADPEADF